MTNVWFTLLRPELLKIVALYSNWSALGSGVCEYVPTKSPSNSKVRFVKRTLPAWLGGLARIPYTEIAVPILSRGSHEILHRQTKLTNKAHRHLMSCGTRGGRHCVMPRIVEGPVLVWAHETERGRAVRSVVPVDGVDWFETRHRVTPFVIDVSLYLLGKGK